MPRRLIHILHHSQSTLHDEPLPALLARSGWHLETAYQQRRFIPDIEVECWTIERRLPREVTQSFRGITHRVFPARGFGYLREFSGPLMRALAARCEAEVSRAQPLNVFLHGSIGYLPTGLLLRFGERTRMFVQNHGERPTARMYTPGRKRPIDYRLRRRLEARALPRAQRIFYLNPASREDYLEIGIAPERLQLSTMGVSLDTFAPDARNRSDKRAHLTVRSHQLCLGFVGRLAPEKRVDLLLRAFAELPGAPVLVVVGDGPERAMLQELATKLAIAERVRFVGHVSEPSALNPLYNALDGLILPSSQEGMPVVVVEALAAGVPVLASDLPGTRMLLEDGRAGRLTQAQTASDLARDIQAFSEVRFDPRTLRERAEAFSWRAVCERHQALLTDN